jgi:pyruvate dehydrogenase E2 component (dihydrolipoamide acetyltransferase)
MPIQILMPALSPTMTEGTVAKWLKKEGDKVASGDVIAEIETDKATMEVEAVDEGVLGKIVVPEGTQNVKVNDVIAVLLGEGEDKSALAGQGAGAPPKPAAAAPAPAETPPKPAPPPAPAPAAPTPAAAPAAAPRPTNGAGQVAPGDGRIFVSPLARRMAANAGIELNAVTGSGPHGRIVKADIEAALQGGKPAARPAPAAALVAAAPAAAKPPAPMPAPSPGQAGVPPFELVPTTTMRKVIARRLTEAEQIPHFFLTVDCHIDPLLKVRADLNTRGEKDGFKLSVNDFVIKAAALALRKMPAVNAAWTDDGMMMFKSIDVSVAVALPAGLITPIIHQADQKGLATISSEMKDLAGRAREGKLKPEEFQGGTFSISNLGMYGMREFTAIINPPQSCILAVGAGEQRPVVKDGALAIQTMMSCTLTCDHRVVDGALGAEFLGVIKKLIEDPLSMML